MTEHRSDQSARRAIQNLLNGNAPEADADADYGPWRETVMALREAHEAWGTSGVKTVFATLARQSPGLANLIAADPVPPQIRWTARQLLAAQFPEPNWAVPGVLPEGLSILAGKPKVGKSWMALQIAQAVATGGRALGQEIRQGPVLYLALEDSPRRLQERLQMQGAPQTDQLVFATEWPSLDRGGLAELQAELERNPYRMVVIDTFSRVVQHSDQNDAAEMTAVLGHLQRIALLDGMSILCVDHHRKAAQSGDDPIRALSGSTAKTGVADALLNLFRDAGRREATLNLIGRDVAERELVLQWDDQLCCWQLVGEAGQIRTDSRKSKVLKSIADLTALGELVCTATIAEYLDMDRGNVNRILTDLMHDGLIEKSQKEGRIQPYLVRG